jgi:hypothetical protein
VIPQAFGRDGCDALVRDMRAGASRPSEPLNLLTGRRASRCTRWDLSGTAA